jgi:hypothetical protein
MILASVKSFFEMHRTAETNSKDRRGDLRRKVLLRAELYPVLGYAEMQVKNVSKSGLAAETSASLQVAQPLLISLDGNKYHLGVVRWVRGRRFGLSLEDAFAIFGLHDEVDSGLVRGHKIRSRRHSIEVAGRIALGFRGYDCIVRDVSQSGMRLECNAMLSVRQQVLVKLKDRPIVLGSVQWCDEGMVGIQAAERIPTLRLAYAYDT